VQKEDTLTAWMAGADVTFEVVRHLRLGGDARVYWLRRDPLPSNGFDALSVAERPTTRFVAGMVVRGVW
jgi:hypothetical protein